MCKHDSTIYKIRCYSIRKYSTFFIFYERLRPLFLFEHVHINCAVQCYIEFFHAHRLMDLIGFYETLICSSGIDIYCFLVIQAILETIRNAVFWK